MKTKGKTKAKGKPKKKVGGKPQAKYNCTHYEPRMPSAKEMEQINKCLNCQYPKSWCDGNPKNCAKRAASEELKAKKAQEASGEEAARLKSNEYYREYRKRQKEQDICKISFL